VSLEFATELGYIKADFQDLRPEEKSGRSSTGHTINPLGAIKLSWFHGTSPQFTNMRFLVVDDYYYALLIGAACIERYQMMSPPNFVQGHGGVSVTQPDGKFSQKSWL